MSTAQGRLWSRIGGCATRQLPALGRGSATRESFTHNDAPSRYGRGLGLLLQLTLVLHHDLAQSLQRDGLTVSRVRVLWELRSRGPMRQRELAEALDVTPRTMTGIV
ncbi:MarR family transcriptional regulator, partial [Pseudonocardia thermophila]|uniref:MarR family transcriptional regulator n=1 Tax=Pseudonocardia thermophila TaxID=1848 RepID=UPI003CD0C68A